VAPLSDVEAQNILKRKRGDLEMAEIEAKFLALKNQKRAQEIQAIEVEATHKQNTVLRGQSGNTALYAERRAPRESA
jgi:hypothetical protein